MVLDVLKPHEPSVLEFARTVADIGADYRVQLWVEAVDKNTETVTIEVQGSDLDFDAVHEAIKSVGGSLHSIDEVTVDAAGLPGSAE